MSAQALLKLICGCCWACCLSVVLALRCCTLPLGIPRQWQNVRHYFCAVLRHIVSRWANSLGILERWAIWLYCFGVILLVLTLVIGVGAKGAQRWISLGFTRFQPAEILKIAVPLTVAAYFSQRHLPPKFVHVVVCMIIILVPSALILKQPDLGTAILVVMSGVIGLF